MMRNVELGQVLSGAYYGDYDVSDFTEALIRSAIDEYARVFWNVNQCEFNTTYCFPESTREVVEDQKLDVPGLEIRPYYWGDDDAEAEKPNLSFNGVEIRWYKYVGRGMTTNVLYTPEQWSKWYNKLLKAIRKQEPDELRG